MSSAGLTGLNWINNIEYDFDKSFIQLDNLFRSFKLPESEFLLTRKHLTVICSSFSHVIQRTQGIFEENAKLEARIRNLEHELEIAIGDRLFAENEMQEAILNFHRLKLENLNKSIDKDTIRLNLDKQLKQKRTAMIGEFRLKACLEIVRKENRSLNKYINSIQNELYGARLASKYLDKELAGRIQQIQLFNQKKTPEREKMWNTLESEINLHRHKAVSRACRVRKPHARTDNVTNKLRRVTLERKPTESLGISITGGLEHGVPIMVSEIVAGHVVANSNALFVGDALLTVNGIDLRDKFHGQAVKILSNLQGRIVFEAFLISVDTDDSEDESQIYQDQSGNKFRLYDEAKAVPALFLHEVQRMQAQKRAEAKIVHRRSMIDQVPVELKQSQMRRSLTIDASDPSASLSSASGSTFPHMLLSHSNTLGPGTARPVSVALITDHSSDSDSNKNVHLTTLFNSFKSLDESSSTSIQQKSNSQSRSKSVKFM